MTHGPGRLSGVILITSHLPLLACVKAMRRAI